MATITRENIAALNDKLVVTVQKEDYLPSFESQLKKYAKTANIPGFRKGMVPAGILKKMYGEGIFNEEVIRTVDAELDKYIQDNKLAILAQPIPVDSTPVDLDMNFPADYTFEFEIGLQPDVNIDLKSIRVTRYDIEVTDKMIDEEVERIQSRFGEYTTPETIEDAANIISADAEVADHKGNSVFELKDVAEAQQKEFKGKKIGDEITVQINKAFSGENVVNRILSDLGLDKEDTANAGKEVKLTVTKIGLLNKAALNEDLYKKAYPAKEIKTEQEFRDEFKNDLKAYFAQQASGQVNDQIYHQLTEHIKLELPEAFLKRWLVVSNKEKKTAEDAEKEYPAFAKQLQWALVSSKLSHDNNVQVSPEEIKDFARGQLLGYLGGQMGLAGNESWIDDYANRMLGDKKFIDEAHGQIRISKLFKALEQQVDTTEQSISEEDFANLVKQHNHEHHHEHEHAH